MIPLRGKTVLTTAMLTSIPQARCDPARWPGGGERFVLRGEPRGDHAHFDESARRDGFRAAVPVVDFAMHQARIGLVLFFDPEIHEEKASGAVIHIGPRGLGSGAGGGRGGVGRARTPGGDLILQFRPRVDVAIHGAGGRLHDFAILVPAVKSLGTNRGKATIPEPVADHSD